MSPDLAIFVANDRPTKPIPLPLAHTCILVVYVWQCTCIPTLEVIAGVRT